MCCCCSQKCVRISMIILASLIVIPGILLFILGGLFQQQFNKLWSGDDGNKIGKAAASATFIMGALAIYIGLAGAFVGCCYTKCEKSPSLVKCCSCIYAVKSLLFFIVFLILGIIFIAVSNIGKTFMTEFCNGTLPGLSGRTQMIYNDLFAAQNELAAVYKAANNQNTTDTSSVTTLTTAILNFAQSAEGSLSCNGICSPGLFFYFLPISTGPPTQTCFTAIQNVFTNNPLGIGILLLISFILTFFVHIHAWAVCCACCGPKEQKKDNWV